MDGEFLNADRVCGTAAEWRRATNVDRSRGPVTVSGSQDDARIPAEDGSGAHWETIRSHQRYGPWVVVPKCIGSETNTQIISVIVSCIAKVCLIDRHAAVFGTDMGSIHSRAKNTNEKIGRAHV